MSSNVDAVDLGIPRNERLRAVGLVTLAFGALCLVSAIFFVGDRAPPRSEVIGSTGGTIGPLEIADDSTVLHVHVQQYVFKTGWSYIEGELLDSEQEGLFSFGDEVWYETGRDSDGPWSERDNEFDLKITIPTAGTYFLAFTVDSGLTAFINPPPTPDEYLSDITVRIHTKSGSTVPFFAAGILGLILGFVMHEMATGAVLRRLARMGEES